MIYKSYQVEQNISFIKEKLVLIYGENLSLIDDLKNEIKSTHKNFEINSYFQEDIVKNQESFFQNILNLSLFEKDKVFFINNATDKILPLVKEIENKIDKQKIFLFSELLDKKSKIRNHFEKSKNTGIVPCYIDNEITLKKIITEKLKHFKNLNTTNINIILENSNLNRMKLKNELEKILVYFSNKELQRDKLESLLNLRENENFNDLKDEAIMGNVNKTNELINDTVLEPEKNILYINIINQRFNKILEALYKSEDSNLEKAIDSLKPPVFWKDKPKFRIQAQKWNLRKIREMLKITYNLELKIKSNYLLNHNILIKKLLIDVCVLANS